MTWLITYMTLLTDATFQQRGEKMTFSIPVCALSDKDLVKKLLTLDLTTTSAKMLKVCHTHIAIADNLNAMGLTGSKCVNEVWKQQPCQPMPQKSHPLLLVTPNIPVVTAPSHMHLEDPPAPLKTTCKDCRFKSHWQPRCQSGGLLPKTKDSLLGVLRTPLQGLTQSKKIKKTNTVDVWDDYEPQCHEVDVPDMAFYALPHAKWPTSDPYHLRNTELTAIRDVSIDALTEAYVTVQMPAQILPKSAWQPKV